MVWNLSVDEQVAAVGGTRQNSARTQDWADFFDEDPEQLIINDTRIPRPESSSDDSSNEEDSRTKTPAQHLVEAREHLLYRNPSLKPRFVYPKDLMLQTRYALEELDDDFLSTPISTSDNPNNDSVLVLDKAITFTERDALPYRPSIRQSFLDDTPLDGQSSVGPELASNDALEVSDRDKATLTQTEDEIHPANTTSVNTDNVRTYPSSSKQLGVYNRSESHPLGYSWEWIDEWGDPLDPEPVMEFTQKETEMARSVRNPYPDYRWNAHLGRWGPRDQLDGSSRAGC